MFNTNQIQGILLSSARPELTIYRNDKKNLGYEVRVRVFFRADNEEFLMFLKDALDELNVTCQFRDKESKVRPKPVLWVSGITNLLTLCRLVPELPDSKNQWAPFITAIDLICDGEHTTQEGLDRLLTLKGAL